MGTDVAEVECTIQVYGAMYIQLDTLISKILGIFPDLEAARPRCSSGIQALIQLGFGIENAKILLQFCSESSKLYLAITGDKIVSRFKKAKQQLEENLSKLQTLVPMILALEISQIVDDLRSMVFIIGPSEQEAGKVLCALLQKDESILSLWSSDLEALQFVASRIRLSSQRDLLVEKRAIKKMLDRVRDTDQQKKRVLRYLQYVLKKHDKQVLEGRTYYASMDHDRSFSVDARSIDADSQLHTNDQEQGTSELTQMSQASAFASLDMSSNSISSCGSLAGLHLRIDISHISLGSEDTSFNSGSFSPKCNDDPSTEFKFFSSKHELETTLLSNSSHLPWESQFMAIEDVQNYLDNYKQVLIPKFSKNFVEPLTGFLKAAVDRQDENAQIVAIRLLSTGVHSSRSSIRYINEDMYLLLASFLGTDMTKDVLSIFHLSVQGNCETILAQSGALTSLLKILDTQYRDFHETAIKLLYNLLLSTESPRLLRFLPLELIPKLAPFLKDTSLAESCLVIMEKLCYTKEACLLVIQTEGCIASIVELLDTGNCEEQEHGVFILLTLCSQCRECCSLVMEEGVILSLICIQVNGNERAQAGAFELRRLLRDNTSDEDEQDGDSASCDCVDGDSGNNSEKKMPSTSKQSGLFSKWSAKLKRSRYKFLKFAIFFEFKWRRRVRMAEKRTESWLEVVSILLLTKN